MFRFEKLDVWQKAVDFAMACTTSHRDFPLRNALGLLARCDARLCRFCQTLLKEAGEPRAEDSPISSKFLDGSLMEVVSQVQLSARRALLKQTERDDMYAKAEELARMLSGLRASLSPEGRDGTALDSTLNLNSAAIHKHRTSRAPSTQTVRVDLARARLRY